MDLHQLFIAKPQWLLYRITFSETAEISVATNAMKQYQGRGQVSYEVSHGKEQIMKYLQHLSKGVREVTALLDNSFVSNTF